MPQQTTLDTELKQVSVKDIDVWDEVNVRHTEVNDGLEELAASINEIGLQHPPLVQKADGRYKLISGQRRFLAIRDILKWPTIPVLVLSSPMDVIRAKIASVSENIHRRPVSEGDLATVCVYLKERLGSEKEAAKVLGISIPKFRSALKFEGVAPELKEMVRIGEIKQSDALRLSEIVIDTKTAITYAKAIAKLPNPKKERYLTVISEDPKISLKELPNKAESLKYKNTLTIHFNNKQALALSQASIKYDSEPEVLSKNAVIDWLKKEGLVE